MTAYYIELNGRIIKEFKRRENALKWAKRRIFEMPDDCVLVWERENRNSVCIFDSVEKD